MCHRQRGRELASSVIDRAKLSMISCMEGESESEEHLFLSEQVLSMFTCLQKRGREESMHLFLSEPCATWILLEKDEREVQHLFLINHTQASEPGDWIS